MSNSTERRIKRSHFPAQPVTRNNYREAAWDCLVQDFEGRCAYSMQHTYRAGGQKCMEVDHFDPRQKRYYKQDYANLFLASRHCNGAKGNRWEKQKRRLGGERFLNCCVELDYGVHILEDPDNHEVVGVTPEGRYHVRHCDLNAPHLVQERTERARMWSLIESKPMMAKGNWSSSDDEYLLKYMEAIKVAAARMIPKIPYLSGEELEKRRALKQELARLSGGLAKTN